METERPHHRSNSNSSSTSELFICFTSRLSSSSSMKISSKSILSPGRTREPSQISLSTSLSRRMRTNGSMKGGQASPMFPTNGKKRGAFENPEPSSPKVTCIGQVRVKTKKQGKKMRSRSKRRGEVSFRKVDQNNNSSNSNGNNVEGSNYQDYNLGPLGHQFMNNNQQQECLPHRNQRWVHLPLTICEALRTFGAEFNCFLPCRSSCMASQRGKEEEKGTGSGVSENGSGNSCGAVFARWLVAVQEGEGEGKGREIELVVGDEERRDSNAERRSHRRHVFEEIEIKEEKWEGNNETVEEEEARVSICIPPKNALLLMRCRSDPVRMAALANKFWECPVPQDEDGNGDAKEEEDEDDGNEEEKGNVEEDEEVKRRVELEMEQKEEEICEKRVSCASIEEHQIPEAEADLVLEGNEEEEENPESSPDINELQEGKLEKDEDEEEDEEEEVEVVSKLLSVEELVLSSCSHEILADPENLEIEEIVPKLLQENEDELEEEEDDDFEERRASISGFCLLSVNPEQDSEENEQDQKEDQPETVAMAEESTEATETTAKAWEEVETVSVTHESSESEDPKTHGLETGQGSKERESQQNVLPDCLLLMMCEPKLSMEVSKETWVCSTDFIRWQPEKPVNKTDGGDEPKKRVSIDSNNNLALPTHSAHQLLQPPRSSCSFPAVPPSVAAAGGGASMATMIEQKLVGAKAYEPFVLKRCKSEPLRSSAKLAPEACFWKNRKLEPHRPATLGVGATGVGF